MNPFQRLFSKKPTKHFAVTPQPTPTPQLESKPSDKETVSIPKPEPFKQDYPKKASSETDPNLHTTPWRTFSIFISSTFADMQAERDLLKNVVIPRVEEELQKKRIRLEMVDLRWGVDTTSIEKEDEREANILKVCLDEIRRCRPFFIGLLGDRYGWVPPVKRMKAALVGEDHIKPEEGKSVTDLEIEFGVLSSKEQLVRSVFYFRNPLPYAGFPKEKAALLSDAHNQSLTEAEKAERKTALEKLKAKIVFHFETQNLKDKVKTYTANWDEATYKVTDLEKWGDMVYTDILEECKNHTTETWDQVPKNWQEQELALLDVFIEQHTHITTTVEDGRIEKVPTFCGREDLLEELKKHLLSDDPGNWGLVLTGESGSGKSAVFSMATKIMQQENCFILAHSAGLSPRAKKVADLLQIWNKQLADHLGIKEDLYDVTKAEDYLVSRLVGEQGKQTTILIEKLQEKFLELLQKASAKKRVVLLIDALDRFEPTPHAKHLSWLPTQMPQNVRLFITAITGTEQKAVNYHEGLRERSIDIFSGEEAKEMLLAYCKRQHKTLPKKIEKIILEKKCNDGQPATSSPLWLSLAVNMLMTLDNDDFEKTSRLPGDGGQQIESYMAALALEFDPLPGPLFLNLVNKAGTVFGKAFTNWIFDFITIGRNGLREKDLEKLLPSVNIAWDSLKFANLRRWFKAQLILQGEEHQWNLAHSILIKALKDKMTSKEYISLNRDIASVLLVLKESDQVRISEAMHHLLEADQLEEAAVFYGGLLTKEAEIGATKVLAGLITEGKGLDKALALPRLQIGDLDSFIRIIRGYLYSLHEELKIDGNLNERLILIGGLLEIVDYRKKIGLDYEHFTYDLSTIYNILGEIHQAMGRFEIALKYYLDESEFLKKSHNKTSKDITIRYALANSYGKLGIIKHDMGDTEKAKDFFQIQLGLLNELNNEYPENDFLRSKCAGAQENLGGIYEDLGDFDKALEIFLSRMETGKSLSEANPHDESLKDDLAVSYLNLGRLFEKMGEPMKALDNFLLSFKFAKAIYETNPNNMGSKEFLAKAYSNLGTIYDILGETDKAYSNFSFRMKLGKELFEANPRDEDLKYGFALSHFKLGGIKDQQKDFEQALVFFEKGILLLKEIHQSNPANENVTQTLAMYYSKISKIYIALGHTDKYVESINADGILMAELYKANPQNEDNKRGLARSYLLQGTMQWYLGEQEKAIGFLKLNCTFLEELTLTNSKYIYLKKDLSLSYSLLGKFYQGNRNTDLSLEYYRKNLELCKEICYYYPDDESVLSNLLNSFLINGKLNSENKKYQIAIEYYENSVNIATRLLNRNGVDPGYIKDICEALFWLSVLYGQKKRIFKSFRNTRFLLDYIDIMKNNNIELDDWMISNKLFKKYWDSL